MLESQGLTVTCVNYNGSIHVGNLLDLSESVSLKMDTQNLLCGLIARIQIISLIFLKFTSINCPYIDILKHGIFFFSFSFDGFQFKKK